MALLPSRTHARLAHDSVSTRLKEATRAIAATTGIADAIWQSPYGLRRWRWYAVEFVLDAADDYEPGFPPVMGAEHEGRTFTAWGACSAAARVLDEDLAEERATRRAKVHRLTWAARMKICALAALGGAFHIGTLACVVWAVDALVHLQVGQIFPAATIGSILFLGGLLAEGTARDIYDEPADKHLRAAR